MGNPIFMYLTLIFVIGIFTGGGYFCLYQYKLYQLTKFSDRWRPWKGSMIGILCLEIGVIFAVFNLFIGVFITSPDIFDVDITYLPIFLLIYGVLLIGASGIWWAGLGLRRYWKEVYTIAIKAASGQ